jgi:hypothetical protein
MTLPNPHAEQRESIAELRAEIAAFGVMSASSPLAYVAARRIIAKLPALIDQLEADGGAEVMRLQGQAEGFAAAVQWLRDRSAMKPPATLFHAATILADQMEQSRIAYTPRKAPSHAS